MAAASTDYFQEVGNPGTATTLASPGHTIGGSSFTVVSTSNWPTTTGTTFAVDTYTLQTVNGVPNVAVRTPGSYTEWEGTVASSTQITGAVLRYGTDQNYSAGSLTRVYIPVASSRENRLVQGIQLFANQDGSLKTTAVQTALGLGNATNTGFTPFGATMVYTGSNGNKEYTATIAADVTSFLPVGAKIAVTRGTAPPTQAMSFMAASSQYASKTSPTGITSTSTLTVDEWVYVTSYPSADVGITSRHDGTNGFILGMTAAGQLKFFNGSVSSQTAYQSLPLKRWVHIAASFSAGTMVLYTNGAVVPSFLTGSGSTITQAGNLQLGAYNSTHFFDGYISEARIWSTAKTQSEIQANMNISLTGSETGLVALFQGNGNFNDKTSNANNLTASGGAIATQAANPMNTVEGGIVTKIGAYSGGVTPLTLSTGDFYNIPNMTLTGAQYSLVETPFNWPNDLHAGKGRRLLYVPIGGTISTSTTSTTNPFTPVQSLTFTVPANCSKVTISLNNPNISSSNTTSLGFYNGTITAANQIGQWNSPGSVSSAMTYSFFVDVVPGSSFTLNMTFFTAAGTASWTAIGTGQGSAVVVETA